MTIELTSIEDVINQSCDCSAVVSSLPDIAKRPECHGDITDIEDIVGALNYHQPNGKHICELQPASKLFKNDLFLVSQLSTDSKTSWISKKSSYATLKTQLLNDLLGAFNLRTMVYESKNAYALTSHNHNATYNKVVWTPNSAYNTTSDVSCLAIVKISTELLETTDVSSNPRDANIQIEELSVNCPMVRIPFPPAPLVGTLRFISSKTIQTLIDANSLELCSNGLNVNPYNNNNKIRDHFDGWVFPNGATIQNINSQLSDAAFVFAGSETASEFTVPDLNNFFQGCGTTTSYSIRTVSGTLGLANHYHIVDPIDMKCQLEIDFEKTKISTSNRCGGDKYIHQGNSKAPGARCQDYSAQATISLDGATLSGLVTESVGSSSTNYHPTHNLLPVMIYIGGTKREYYESC